jgi:hypothetical protein
MDKLDTIKTILWVVLIVWMWAMGMALSDTQERLKRTEEVICEK